MDRPHDHAPETVLDWLRAGTPAALATVVETWASSPCPVGSQLAVSGSGAFIGSVSGGCIEAAVVGEALLAMADRKTRLVGYGIADETAFAAGLACGGKVRILIEPAGEGGDALPSGLLGELVAARGAARPVALVTGLADGSRRLVFPGEDPDLAERFRLDQSGLTEDGQFVAIHNPPLRLILIGAVHIAAPLLTIARACGYACTLIDPRDAFGSASRFPGESVLTDWPDAGIERLGVDARTAIVTLTHDEKLDDPALIAALKTPAFYIGCLGSSRTHAARTGRLAAVGVPPSTLARLHGPVGLKIGATTAAEIALSIMAEMTSALRKAGAA